MARVEQDDIQDQVDNITDYPSDADTSEVIVLITEDLDALAERLNLDEIKQADRDRIWQAFLAELSEAGGELHYSIAFVRGVKRGLNVTTPFIID